VMIQFKKAGGMKIYSEPKGKKIKINFQRFFSRYYSI